MFDDEDEESNFPKYRALLDLAKVRLRLVSSNMMDHIVMDQDDDIRLSLLEEHDSTFSASNTETCNLPRIPPAHTERFGEPVIVGKDRD